jgi:hypothetical protein
VGYVGDGPATEHDISTSGRSALGARTVFGRDLHLPLDSTALSESRPAPTPAAHAPAEPTPPPAADEELDESLLAVARPPLPARALLAASVIVGLAIVAGALVMRRPAAAPTLAAVTPATPASLPLVPALPAPSARAVDRPITPQKTVTRRATRKARPALARPPSPPAPAPAHPDLDGPLPPSF